MKSFDENSSNNLKKYFEYPPVTLSLPEWQQYVASGNNTLLGSGGVIPGGTMQTVGGNSGAV